VVPEFHFGHVVGSGHFCQLEVPAQVNAMIDRFLALVSP
jgi:pimeloyl-ACP methyl ester carboxylesterase